MEQKLTQKILYVVLIMILTSEGSLQLSISPLTGGRPQCWKGHRLCWCPLNLQQRANPFEEENGQLVNSGSYLFSSGRDKSRTGVKSSCCAEVGQRTKVVALRVIPGPESGLWIRNLFTCPPSHGGHCHVHSHPQS